MGGSASIPAEKTTRKHARETAGDRWSDPMTDLRLASFPSPASYWQASRPPRYSLLFALPLLTFYQVLAVLLSTGPRAVRNGADVILQGLFVAVAGTWGPPLFMICLIAGGLWLVARGMRAPGSRLESRGVWGGLGGLGGPGLVVGVVGGGGTARGVGVFVTLTPP